MAANDTVGNQNFTARNNDLNAQSFLIKQLLGRVCTMQLAQVTAVTPAGTGSLAQCYVQLLPMVAMIDGSGNPTPHGKINNCPYVRLQGGDAGIVADPIVGDIGLAIFAMRDISAVKRALVPSNPGSRRQYNFSDGIYLGGSLNGALMQFIQFVAGGGIVMTSTGDVTLNASGNINLNGTLVINGEAYLAHMHSEVMSGSDDTGGVVT